MNTAKRFLEPIKYRKAEYLKQVIQAFLFWVNWVIHVLFLELIVRILESWIRQDFYNMLIVYFSYVIIFEIVYFTIRKWWWVNTMPYTISDNFVDYLKKYIHLDNNTIEKIGTGKMVGILWDGCRTWWVLITDVIEKWISLIVTLMFTIYMISRIESIYWVYFIVLLIVFFLIALFLNTKLKPFRSRRYEYRNIRVKQYVKILMSKMEVLHSDKIDYEAEQIYKNTAKISNLSREMATFRTCIKRISPFGITLILLWGFYYFWEKVLSWEVSISILVGLSWALILMQRSIADFIGFYVQSSKDFVKVQKMWDFFDTTPKIEWYDTGLDFVHKTGEISLKNISYWYDERQNVLNNFSIDIQWWMVTAFVGPSWWGKSTLVKLISGYIKKDSGDITVDWQKLSEVSLKSYYTNIGYLTQDPSVFDGSIRENLLYAIWDPTSETQIKTAIKMAHCEFIYDLKDGIDTEIGERGIKLSGWQKQRLAIAKIFLKNPKIIILDEPTSALDSLSEQKITEAMHNLFSWRTVLVIAHRLQTVKHADKIIVIDWWKVIETGSHSSLVRKKWFYKQMLDLQSGF